MEARTMVINGKDELWLASNTEHEKSLIVEFARTHEPLKAQLYYDDGYKYPLIIIRKETSS